MRFGFKKTLGTLIIAVAIAVNSLVCTPVMATGVTEIILKDVTQSNTTTLTGEAKIQVSIKGDVSAVTAMQAALDFRGQLSYKSVDYLIEADAPAEVEASAANAQKKISVGFALSEAVSFVEETPVFVLTFEGNANESVTVTVDNEHSYCYADGSQVYATGESSITAQAAESANEGMTAIVKVKMDKVSGFITSDHTGITLKITDQSNGNIIKATLNEDNRDSGSKPEFTITTTVIKGNKYTVELSGIGYKTYTAKDVTFQQALLITNKEFIPGDVDKDGSITANDKAAYEKLIQEDDYNEAADFNRDGYVDEKDNVFGSVSAEKTVPAKMAKPSVSGGKKSISVGWVAPSDGGSKITGYIIKYGTSKSNLTNTVQVSDAATTGETITGLSADTTYYVSIAAKNAKGTGELSDVASAKTNKPTGEGAGGGGGGGSSSGGGGGSSSGGGGGGMGGGAPMGGVITPQPSVNEPFTDLGNHTWAKDSVYALKNKGIISGISETEFAPANNIKRGDFMLILTRMLSIGDEFSENFADVPADSYYYNAIGSAKAAGVASGDGQNFMPENSITRQDLITLAYRAFLKKGYISETDDRSVLDAFADKGNIAEYALSPMASMVKTGIIQGADGNVNPQGNATRAEVAVMCARLVALMN